MYVRIGNSVRYFRSVEEYNLYRNGNNQAQKVTAKKPKKDKKK